VPFPDIISVRMNLQPQPEGGVTLMARAYAFISPDLERQAELVRVNGEEVGKWEFRQAWAIDEYAAHIPAPVVARSRPLEIVFDIENPAAPRDYGINQDRRKLGINIHSLELAAAPSAPGRTPHKQRRHAPTTR